MLALTTLQATWPTVAAAAATALLARCLPIALAGMFAARAAALTAVGFVACLALPAWLLHDVGGDPLSLVSRVAGVLAYFACATGIVVAVQRVYRAQPFARVLLFGGLAGLFLLAPALLLPPRPGAFATVIGWEMMFAAYSFCLSYEEEGDGGSLGALRECAFFLLVNPTLVYPRRGERISDPQLSLRVTARVLLGALVVGTSQAFMLIAPQLPALRALTAGPGALGGLIFMVAFYLEHSGVASIQVGMMRALGYRIPERYDLPFLAKSPADFWRRWNIWLGDFCRLYLFRPLSLWLGRTTGHPRLALAIGALLTFVVIGALHDAAALASLDRRGAPVTLLFAVLGAVFLVWEALARLLRKLGLLRLLPRRGRTALSWLLMVALDLWLARLALQAFHS